MNDRRQEARARFEEELLVKLDGRQLVCRAVDLSATGLGLQAPAGQARPAACVQLQLSIPGDLGWLDLEGKVVRDQRVPGRGRVWGIRFVGAAAESAERIRRFVAHRQPAVRARPARGGIAGSGIAIHRLYDEAVQEVERSAGQPPSVRSPRAG